MGSLCPEISVVVPVYKSAATLIELTERIEATLTALHITYEIILSDDDSPDNTWQVIELLCKDNSHIKGLKLATNSGQWKNTLAGISQAAGDYIVTIDDDLEYAPEDIAKLYRLITTENYKVVFGIAADKYVKQKKFPRISKLRKRILELFWKTALADSFKIFHRDVVFSSNKFLPDILLQAFLTHHVNRKFWGYVNVVFNKRPSGLSNHTFIGKVKLFWLYSLHYYRNSFFMVVEISIFLFALAACISFILFCSSIPSQLSIAVAIIVWIVLSGVAYKMYFLFSYGRHLFSINFANKLNM